MKKKVKIKIRKKKIINRIKIVRKNNKIKVMIIKETIRIKNYEKRMKKILIASQKIIMKLIINKLIKKFMI